MESSSINETVESQNVEATGAPAAELTKKEKSKYRKARIILAIALLVVALMSCALLYLLVPMMGLRLPAVLGNGDAGITWVRSIYGWGKAPNQQTQVRSVDILPDQSGFVAADPQNARVVFYTMNGRLIKVLDGKKNSKIGFFRNPANVAIDRDWNTYVAEPTYDIVRVFDRNDKEIYSFPAPRCSAIEVTDDYVIVGSRGGFAVLDHQGKVVKVVGSQGADAKAGQFNLVSGIAVDSQNNIYVVDAWNNYISKYTVTGKRLWIVQTGHKGSDSMTGEKTFNDTTKAKMQVPYGCTVDGNGHLLVGDLLKYDIAMFDTKSGKYIKTVGDYGAEDGKFLNIGDLKYVPTMDSVVIADSSAYAPGRAQIVTISGTAGDPASGTGAALKRLLTGPAVACLIPILLFIIALIVVSASLAKRRAKQKSNVTEGKM